MLGYRLRYVGPDSMYTDLYVYPGPAMATACDVALASGAAEAEIAGFREAFSSMIERHYVDKIAVTRDDPLHPGLAVPWCVARHLTLEVVRQGRPEHSDFYLYVLSGYFVKVRMTYPFTDTRLALEQAFISDVFTRLTPK